MRASRFAAVLRSPMLLGLSLAALAGCSKPADVDVKNGSPETVARSVTAAGLKFTPGRWETTVAMTRFDIGKDMPPQAKEMMKAMMGKTRNLASCLTPEQAAKPGPEFFGEQRSGCTYDHFTMGGGTIDAKMVCKGEGAGAGAGANGGGAMTMTMTGTYTADNYAMKVASSGNQGGMPIAMDLTMTAHRAGACNGTELK